MMHYAFLRNQNQPPPLFLHAIAFRTHFSMALQRTEITHNKKNFDFNARPKTMQKIQPKIQNNHTHCAATWSQRRLRTVTDSFGLPTIRRKIGTTDHSNSSIKTTTNTISNILNTLNIRSIRTNTTPLIITANTCRNVPQATGIPSKLMATRTAKGHRHCRRHLSPKRSSPC